MSFSEKDLMFLAKVLQHNKSKLEPDYEKVAEATGLKNADVARARFTQIKKKIFGASPSPKKPTAKDATSAKPRGQKSKKRKAVDKDSDHDHDDQKPKLVKTEDGEIKVKLVEEANIAAPIDDSSLYE